MKMMKMISALMLAALVLVTASCTSKSETPAVTTTQNAETTTAAETTAAPETTPKVDILSFLNDGEIYVELKLDASVKNASVSLDGTQLSGSKTAYKKGMEFTLNGEYAEDGSVNILVVYAKGGKGTAEANVEFKKGVDVEMVSQIVTRCLDREDAQKVFVSLFEKDGSWDTSLSKEMNDFIRGMYPVQQ